MNGSQLIVNWNANYVWSHVPSWSLYTSLHSFCDSSRTIWGNLKALFYVVDHFIKLLLFWGFEKAAFFYLSDLKRFPSLESQVTQIEFSKCNMCYILSW